MPTLAEGVRLTEQLHEEAPAIKDLNTFPYVLHRLLIEVQEAEAAYYTESKEALLEELIDVYHFLSALIKHTVDDMEADPELADQVALSKHGKNMEKYNHGLSRKVGMMIAGKEYTHEDFIREARHNWKHPIPENGSDVY